MNPEIDHTVPSLVRNVKREIEYTPIRQTFKRSARFARLQSKLLKKAVKIPPDLLWAASLALFEGICDSNDILAIQKTGEVYLAIDVPRLQWTRMDGRRGARNLSTLSVIALHKVKNDPRVDGTLTEGIEKLLLALDPVFPCPEDRLGFLMRCSEAWLYRHLPPYLFSHACGDRPMTPLPRSAYARAESGLALSESFNLNFCNLQDDCAALESYFHSVGEDTSGKLIDDIVDAASLLGHKEFGDTVLLGRMASKWRGMVDKAEISGPLSCLLLSHAIDMAIKGDYPASTLVGYIKNGVPAVYRGLHGKEIEGRSSDDFSKDFALGLSTLSGENQRKASAYVGHFHQFVSELIDVAPLQKALLPTVVRTPTDANVIWSHEGRRIDEWSKLGDKHDGRLSAQTRIVRRLMAETAARPSEIFFLQIRNVRVSNGVVEGEIATRGRLHKLKSPDAQRTFRISDESFAAEVLGWATSRRIEGGLGPDLLFGTREVPRRCFRLGAMYSWLNQALKAATGDPTSCCHHFRHSVIDNRFLSIALGLSPAYCMDQLRVDAGHVDLMSTLSYMHSFPAAMRLEIDNELRKADLTSAGAGFWSGAYAGNLRQRARRAGLGVRAKAGHPDAVVGETRRTSNYLWTQIASAAAKESTAVASESISMCCPISFKPLGAKRPWTVCDVIGFLSDVQAGYPPLQAGRQWLLDPDLVEVLCKELLEIANWNVRITGMLKGLRLTDPRAALELLKLDIDGALHSKYDSWRGYLRTIAPPEISEEVVDAWQATGPGKYIRLDAARRADRWLGLLVSLKFPTSKLAIVQVKGQDDILADTRRCVSLAIAQGGSHTAATAPRGFEVDPRPGRPACYLLVANEGEILTNHTGAAFTPKGLIALMFAIRLASHCYKSPETLTPK